MHGQNLNSSLSIARTFREKQRPVVLRERLQTIILEAFGSAEKSGGEIGVLFRQTARNEIAPFVNRQPHAAADGSDRALRPLKLLPPDVCFVPWTEV